MSCVFCRHWLFPNRRFSVFDIPKYTNIQTDSQTATRTEGADEEGKEEEE